MNLMLLQEHPQWEETLKIYRSVISHGYVCYFVGGCVRNLCLGVAPRDFDLATSASPKELKKIFKKTIDIGERFGTIILSRKDAQGRDFQIEITRFRFDKDYKDGRNPESLFFLGEREDALRRDFTMNALFYDPSKRKIIDYVGGQSDIADKKIRTVGEPEKRFAEDHLRILRAVRFSSSLGFSIDKKTLLAAVLWAPQVHKLASERIQKELVLFFKGENFLQALFYFQTLNFDKILFSTFKIDAAFWINYKSAIVSTTTISLENTVALFVALSLGSEKKLTALQEEQIKLRFSKSILREVELRVELLWELAQPLPTQGTLQIMPTTLRLKFFKMLEQKDMRAFLKLINPYLVNKVQEKLKNFVREFYHCTNEKMKLPEPFLTAQNLMKEGLKGKKIGELLELGYLTQIKGGFSSQAEALLWLSERGSSTSK